MGSDKFTKWGAVAALSALSAACSRPDPEARLRAAIDAMEVAVESRDAGGFLEHVAHDFSGESGQIDRASLRGLIVAQTVRNESIGVVLTPPVVKLHGETRATVEVNALVTGGRMLPERGRTLAIKSGWRLEDGEWVCYSASWE